MTDSSSVTIFGGQGKVALTNTDALKRALDTSVQDDPRGGGEDGVYINFSGKRGVYEIGPDKDGADPDEIWLVNTASFESGWICWKGGRPVAKRMASIYGDPVVTPDMTEHGPFPEGSGEGWFICKSMTLRSLDSGVQGVFTTNSKSGVSSLVGIQKEIASRVGDLPSWAIIQLSHEEFSAQGNKNFKPVFPVFGWLGDAQINALAELEEITEDDINRLCDDAENGVMSYDNGEDTKEESVAENDPDDEVDDKNKPALKSDNIAASQSAKKVRRGTAKDQGRRRRASV